MGHKKRFSIAFAVESYGDMYKEEPDGSIVDIDLTLGMYKVVDDPADRIAIPAGKRKDGMKVYEKNTGITNQLVGGITDGDWFPDIIKQTFINGGNNKFVVADITKFKSVHVRYIMSRGSLEELGSIVMSNTSGKPVSRNFDGDFCGVNLQKQITINDLEMTWVDIISNGDDTEFIAYIERVTL